jgi:hypothetical protein
MCPNFVVERTVRRSDGKPIYNSDGSIQKEKIPMSGATFHNRQSQSLYFETEPDAGIFKGMKTILTERGYNVKGKNAECPLDADSNHHDCCMRWMLINEPNFAGVQSLLE